MEASARVHKIEGRRVTSRTFGELRAEVERPQDIDIENVIIVLAPKDEAEMNMMIDATGGPLAWDAPSPGRTMWHRERDFSQGVSLHLNLPPLPDAPPPSDPVALAVIERQQKVGERVRAALTEHVEKMDIPEGDVPRAVEALMREGVSEGERIDEARVAAALHPEPVT